MTDLEEIAETLQEILSAINVNIAAEAKARAQVIVASAPRPKPHEVMSIAVPLHLTQFEDGMWEATSPVVPKLSIQSADKTKLVEVLVPEAIAKLAL